MSDFLSWIQDTWVFIKLSSRLLGMSEISHNNKNKKNISPAFFFYFFPLRMMTVRSITLCGGSLWLEKLKGSLVGPSSVQIIRRSKLAMCAWLFFCLCPIFKCTRLFSCLERQKVGYQNGLLVMQIS